MKVRTGWLWALLALALVLRTGFGLTREGLLDSSDERHWDGMARAVLLLGLRHPDVGAYRPPLYPLMIAGIYRVVGNRPAAVRLWQALLGTATCALLFGIGRRMGGEGVGLVAAGLGAAYPLFVFFSGVLMAETLLVFLTTAALLLALRFEARPSARNAAALGAVLGLGVLCKPVLLPWAAFLAGGWWLRCGLGRGQRAVRVGALAGAVALVVAPWAVRNAAVTGHFVPISLNLGMNLMIGNEPGAVGVYRDEADYLGMFDRLTASAEGPVAKDRLAARTALGWIAEAPGRFAGLAFRKLVVFWRPLVPEEPAFRNLVALFSCGPILALGLRGTFRLRGRWEAWVVGTLALSLSLVHAVFFSHIRFRLPVDAALMGPAAVMVVRWWDGRKDRRTVESTNPRISEQG